MPDVVVVETARTPIARAFKGSLTEVRPDDLCGSTVKALIDKVPGFPAEAVEDLICGTANESHEQGMNLGRNVASLAGLPDTVPGTTVNRFCASSLQALRIAFHAVKASEGDAFVACGVESVSRTWGKGFDDEDRNPRFVDREREDYLNDMYITMGVTAENVAREWGVSRERMDEFAALSQQRAAAARDSGFFEREITPVQLGNGKVFDQDECIRPATTVAGLSELKPAFAEDGSVTAGNSCPLNDGASAVLVMSEQAAERFGLSPRARILGSAVSGVRPEVMGIGPIEAMNKLFARCGVSVGDVDIVELNEAFAAQVLVVCDELKIDIEGQLNPFGGAIALGHPFGSTGGRLTSTLLNGLETRDAELGAATMCVGGGQGMAMLFERL